MTHHYRVYGLHLRCNRELSLLPTSPEAKPDLDVHWSSTPDWSPDSGLEWRRVLTTELQQRIGISLWRAQSTGRSFTKLRYNTEKAHIDFILAPTLDELWVVHASAEPDSDLQAYFVGPALGCVLRLRGTLCLHASVVKIDDCAVAILGKKKSGKSTSAAGLALLGAAVLSDDMAVLTPHDGGFLVQPGYPQVRLWPRSIAALYPNRATLPKVYTTRDKRYLRLGSEGSAAGAFWPSALPLAAIYVLGEIDNGDATPYIEALPPQEKLMTLVENVFGSYVVIEELRQREFVALGQVSKAIPLRRLMFGHDLATLPEQSRAIIEDVRSRKREEAAASFV